jgi:hypothetical protein
MAEAEKRATDLRSPLHSRVGCMTEAGTTKQAKEEPEPVSAEAEPYLRQQRKLLYGDGES